MSNRLFSLSAATAIVLASLGTGSAIAAEPGAVYGAKAIGAMTLESLGRATNGMQIARQGGFALPGAVQWIRTPTVAASVSVRAF